MFQLSVHMLERLNPLAAGASARVGVDARQIGSALLWRAKREYRVDLAKKRASRFSKFRKAVPQPAALRVISDGSFYFGSPRGQRRMSFVQVVPGTRYARFCHKLNSL
jgi:hypothetical protein